MEKVNVNKYLKKCKDKEIYTRFYDFKSISDLLNVVSIPLEDTELYSDVYYYRGKYTTNMDSDRRYSKNSNFCVTDSLEECLKLAKYGWENGTVEIIKNLKTISNLGNDKSYVQKYDVVGGQACVARYLQGVPTNMINRKTVEKKAKILNIYTTFTSGSTISKDELLEANTKMIKIIKTLENNGYRCNLYSVKYNMDKKHKHQKCAMRLKLKSSTEKLNIKKIAFFIANPDYIRRLFFRLIELHPDLKKEFTYYGCDMFIDYRYIPDVEKSNGIKKIINRDLFTMDKNDIVLPPFISDSEQFINSIGDIL